MGSKGYLLIRFVLWVAAVGIALFPTFSATPVDVSFSFWDTAQSVNKAGLFRDLFFVVVPTSVLALATTTDFLATCYPWASGNAQAACVLCLLLNFAALASGFVGFLELPTGDHILRDRQVVVYGTLIVFAVAFSLLTEIGISWASYRHHRELMAARRRY